MSLNTIITEKQFQDYIKRGDSVFNYENKVYKVNNFKNRHPGGLAAITCGLGKDATDEIRAFHPLKVYQTMINRYCIGSYLPASKKKKKQLEATWEGGMGLTAFNKAIEELYSQHGKVEWV